MPLSPRGIVHTSQSKACSPCRAHFFPQKPQQRASLSMVPTGSLRLGWQGVTSLEAGLGRPAPLIFNMSLGHVSLATRVEEAGRQLWWWQHSWKGYIQRGEINHFWNKLPREQPGTFSKQQYVDKLVAHRSEKTPNTSVIRVGSRDSLTAGTMMQRH